MVVIVTATGSEMRLIRKKARIAESFRRAGALFMRAYLQGHPLVLVQSGVGARKAAAAARAIAGIYPEARVVSLGAAGALAPALAVGDVLLAVSILHAGTGECFAADVGLTASLEGLFRAAGINVERAACLQVRRFISTPAEKQALAGRWNVQMLDMESASLARVFCPAGIPFADVRIVSDAAQHHMPDVEKMAAIRCSKGRLGVIAYLLQYPRETLRAVVLLRNMRVVQKKALILARYLAVLSGNGADFQKPSQR